MAEIIRIPRVSTHDHALKAIDTFVQVGDYVNPQDPLDSFESQSRTFELEAHFEGRMIYSSLYQVGDMK